MSYEVDLSDFALVVTCLVLAGCQPIIGQTSSFPQLSKCSTVTSLTPATRTNDEISKLWYTNGDGNDVYLALDKVDPGV